VPHTSSSVVSSSTKKSGSAISGFALLGNSKFPSVMGSVTLAGLVTQFHYD
jgi:hypothetical protein